MDDLGFGAVWHRIPAEARGREPASREQAVAAATAALAATPPRSVVVVGEPGVGTAAFAKRLAADRKRRGDDVLEASAFAVNAGMSLIGELEGRVAEIVQAARRGSLTWLLHDVHETAVAGVWKMDPHGLFGKLAPLLVEGDLRIVADTTPAGWASLRRRRPDLTAAVEVVQLGALAREETIALARERLPAAPEALVREAVELAVEHLPGALPGPVLRVLDLAEDRRRRAGRPELRGSDLLEAIAEATGLPPVLIDPALPLDLEALEQRLSAAVIGQPEAVAAVVERLAMAKAGLVDPTRPLSVLLFAGPTGTGKTELAKQLATFLAGSQAGLVRFDLSEYAEPGAVVRLLGGDDAPGAASGLVTAISEQPGAVLLLDEFEKAHPSVWDVFLQVFDDGRATDADGNVADVRHATIIMTSNLGASQRGSTVLGFATPGSGRAAEPVEVAIRQVFRPEFVNRIDRVVVFRPLTREVMRRIVRRELAAVEQRRGLRSRPWAIEWDDSAVDALLDRGITPDLGARPLKRAIEEHLLVPLARSIVGRAVPTGEQFLFVRAGDREPIEVLFVDPDAPAPTGAQVRHRVDAPLDSPRRIALDALGSTEELAVLQAALEAQRAGIARAGERKAQLLVTMAAPHFWTGGGDLAVLTAVERRDRLEAGFATALKLQERLARAAGRSGAAEVAGLLAQRLFLLDEELAALEADEPRDALLAVRPVAAAGSGWAQRLLDMYRGWAHRRGMALAERAGTSGDVVLEVTGFGAHRLLRAETGLHIWQSPAGTGGRTRSETVLVVCAPAGADTPEDPVRPAVVRHYRAEPSPLVRDVRAGWRTGRLATVLDGNFDLQ